MEKGLRTTLDKMGVEDIDYAPSPRSRDALRAEAAGNIRDFVSQYADVSESVTAQLAAQDSFLDNPEGGFGRSQVMRWAGDETTTILASSLMVAALVGAAIFIKRRSRSGNYEEISSIEDDLGR
eukprot:FR738043.1.p1 GENE.FR738043.1~~FR738043.1.p1  ORF type:complete len:134 (+),score=15.17 FR738043.1:33-404(+)